MTEKTVTRQVLKKQHYQLFLLCSHIKRDFETLAFSFTEYCGVFQFILIGGGAKKICSKLNRGVELEAIQELESKLLKAYNVRVAGQKA